MDEKFVFILELPRERDEARRCLATVPSHYTAEFRPTKRTELQSRKFHAMCGDFAASGIEWFGKRRTRAEWKILLVSGHAAATGDGSEVVAGLEGELVQLRERTAAMGVRRGASLIEYTQAMGDLKGVVWKEVKALGAARLSHGDA